jgi:hypothetical protein
MMNPSDSKSKEYEELQAEYLDFKGSIRYLFLNSHSLELLYFLLLSETSGLLEEEMERKIKELSKVAESLQKENNKLKSDAENSKVVVFLRLKNQN